MSIEAIYGHIKNNIIEIKNASKCAIMYIIS